MVNLDFRTKSEKPKSKKSIIPKTNMNAASLIEYTKILGAGLSFGSGILGVVYLTTLAVPNAVVGVFGFGVVISHLAILSSLNKGKN